MAPIKLKSRIEEHRFIDTDDVKGLDEVHDKRLSIDKNAGREGWASPQYVQSRGVELDYGTAEENRCMCLFPDRPEIEYYKMLRTQIRQRTNEKGWNTIMITSVNHEEGKTLTAINLALTFAKEFDQTVLLVDADFRNQTIHKYLGYSVRHNLIDYLEYGRSLQDVIVWPGIEKLTVISGSHTVQDSTEILGSPRMGSLVAEMKSRYENRYIIFDVPPVLSQADAATFAPLVDCVVLTISPGRATLQDILRAVDMLPEEKILGFAMNRHQAIKQKRQRYDIARACRNLFARWKWRRKSSE